MNRAIFAFVLCLAASGCVREVDIENQPGTVTSVGPLSLDAQQNVVVPFTVRDLEGDDQGVQVDVCTAPGEGCGAAETALGGDRLDRLPTIPKDTDVLHEFRWQPWCGRWSPELQPQALDESFVVAVWVASSGSEPLYSEPTSLADLGATEGSCD